VYLLEPKIYIDFGLLIYLFKFKIVIFCSVSEIQADPLKLHFKNDEQAIESTFFMNSWLNIKI